MFLRITDNFKKLKIINFAVIISDRISGDFDSNIYLA